MIRMLIGTDLITELHLTDSDGWEEGGLLHDDISLLVHHSNPVSPSPGVDSGDFLQHTFSLHRRH